MPHARFDVDTLFCQAIAIDDAAARRTFISQAAGGNLLLQRHLEKLVAAHFEAGEFLQQPVLREAAACAAVADPALTAAASASPGSWIGPYRIRELLGEGGMGSVYVAEQEHPIRRKVALKVIKPGMDSREIIARFEAERQALTLMDHPHIARVLDAGTTELGRPYFVMELVKGLPITEHCDAHRSPIRERLELFLQVCQAVQHAHQKAVIHRDLKPSNVLIALLDTTPQAKVIDFGVAKALGAKLTDRTLYTGFSQVIGTPLYMSPEQAGQSSLDIDTRSDVYALGVLLYELLAGDTPLSQEDVKQSSLDEIRRLIREVDPPLPSVRVGTAPAASLSTICEKRQVEPRQLTGKLRGELDWIVMRALEKDRARRYESASALAADVQRYLSDQPVDACPPSKTYRLGKFVRRNKARLTVAALFLASVPVLFTAAMLVAVAQRRAALSESELDQRRLAVERGINEAVTQVARLRQHGKPFTAGDDAHLSQAREQLQRALALAAAGPANLAQLARVRELSQELEAEQRHRQLRVALEQAWMAQMHVDITRSSNSPTACIPVLRQALEAYGVNVGDVSTDQAAVTIQRQPDPVREHLLAALEEWWQLAPPPIGVSLQITERETRIAAIVPESVAYRDGRLKKGDQLTGIGQGHAGPIVDIRELPRPEITKLLAGEPGTYVRLQILQSGETKSRICELQRDTTRDWLRAVVDAVDKDSWRKRLRQAYDLQDRTAQRAALETLADEVDLESQPVRALTRLAARLSAPEKSAALLKRVWQHHPSDLMTLSILGNVCLWNMKPPQLEEAVRYYTAAIVLQPANAGPHFNVACALERLGRMDEAIAEYRETHRLEPDWPAPLVNASNILQQQGKMEEALAEYRRAVQARPDNCDLHTNYGSMLFDAGRFDEAIAAHRTAIRIEPDFALAHMNLGCALSSQGRLEEAIAEHRTAIRLRPEYFLAHYNLGYVLSKQAKLDEAIVEYREATRLGPEIAFVRVNLGNALRSQRKWDEAIGEYREAMRLKPDWGDPHHCLALVWRDQGKPEQAMVEFREAIRLQPQDLSIRDDFCGLLQKLGKHDEAIAEARAALQVIPNGVHLHVIVAHSLEIQGKWSEALAELREAVRLAPSYGVGHNALALSLCLVPDTTLRDPTQALEHARRASECPSPSSTWPDPWCTLGIAYYRCGQWQEAISALQKCEELSQQAAVDSSRRVRNWLFLAMTYGQLQQTETACEWYEKATAWMEVNAPDDDLQRVRGEAEALLKD